MEFGVLDTLNLLGSLGLFLIGMKIMSDALMELAGNRMRRIMAELTSNRFKGMLTGLFITGLIQSSSSTTLMVVSFVNAGLLSLTEALGVRIAAPLPRQQRLKDDAREFCVPGPLQQPAPIKEDRADHQLLDGLIELVLFGEVVESGGDAFRREGAVLLGLWRRPRV